MKLPFALRRETTERLLSYITRLLLAVLLAGARLFGGYAPFAIGFAAAAGDGWAGFAALLGAAAGAAAFLDFSHALRTTACCVLLFAANNAFCELRAYRKPYFLPAMTAAIQLAVETVYVLRADSAAEAVNCALSVALAALFAYCVRVALAEPDARYAHPAARLMLLLGALTALAVPQLRGGFAPGRIAAVLAVLLLAFDRELAAALPAALCVGLCVDLAAPETAFFHTACYGFGALLTGLLRRESRVRAALAFTLGTAAFALLRGAAGLVTLYEGLAGTLLFLLLPTQTLRAMRDRGAPGRESVLRRRLRETADGLRELYESVARAEPPQEENPSIVYDRAAETVCRDCSLRERCWVNEYNRTYTALSDATQTLLQSGAARGADFPTYFADRCIRFPSFLASVNTELRAYLLRRQYRRQLRAANARAAGQYAQFSELLAQTAEGGAAEAGAALAPIPYRVALTLRPKDGEAVSGDSATTFETETGALCLLLSDGMGSGEAARRESAMTVRLVERFLRAGVDAAFTLRTLNGALNLRAEAADSFTTVDLLTLSLKNGEGELYKYGAAPSYVKRGARVHRVSCSCLPAGLAEGALPPENTRVRLESGSFFVMVTDGVADAANDAWLQSLLADWEGDSPRQLVSAILAESYDHKGADDDAGVLALYLPEKGGAAAREV